MSGAAADARPPRLPFDPIDRAAELWEERIGDATAMKVVTSVMRVQQVLLARIDAALKPFGITFARYEVLVLLTFSRTGRLPLSKIGERLMVHPTSVTNAIDRLEAGRLVRAGCRTRSTAAGRSPSSPTRDATVVREATAALQDNEFFLDRSSVEDADHLYALLRRTEAAAGDFTL